MFKAGDKVKCVDNSGFRNFLEIDKFYVVSGVYPSTITLQDFGICEYYKDRFVPIPKFDLKTNPWHIKVNNEVEFNLVQEWLKEQGVSPVFSGPFEYSSSVKCITNVNFITGKIHDTPGFLRSLFPGGEEIKINFKTIIDNVEFPVVECETEAQKELKEIQKKIKELEESAKRLQDKI